MPARVISNAGFGSSHFNAAGTPAHFVLNHACLISVGAAKGAKAGYLDLTADAVVRLCFPHKSCPQSGGLSGKTSPADRLCCAASSAAIPQLADSATVSDPKF